MSNKASSQNSDVKEEYEIVKYGPLVIERNGRNISMRNVGTSEDIANIRKVIEEKRPELKQQIDSDIKLLVGLIKEYDPKFLIHNLAFENTMGDIEKFSELTSKIQEARIEFALSLVASVKDVGAKEPKKEVIEIFNKKIEEIRNNVIQYFLTEPDNGTSEDEKEIREWSILRSLGIRGNSFFEHHIQLVKELFQSSDGFLEKNYGFNTLELTDFCTSIEEQIKDNFDKGVDNYRKVKDLHKIFQDFVKKSNTKYSKIEDLRKAFNELPEVNKISNTIDSDPFPHFFEIKPLNPKQQVIIDLLSFKYGDNYNPFLTYKKAPGWPTNDSIIYKRPIISVDGKYYCFGLIIIYRNLIPIIESLIEAKDKDYFQKHYQEKYRKEFLENKTLKYLEDLLPGATIYQNLFYRPDSKNPNYRVETDGVILYDTNIFIIEAKSGSLSQSSRRGSLLMIRKEAKRLVGEAYNQALRTKEYINNTSKPIFEQENGKPLLEITDKTKYKNIYLITTTLDPLDHLSTQLNSLKNIGLIEGKEWPWTVFVNDLQVISEIIEFPSVFISFLQHRIRANDFPQFKSIDELDFFMFYLREGLYFEDGRLKGLNGMIPTGYTEDLERYYNFKAGLVSSGVKPKVQIGDNLIKFIKEIESSKKAGFTQLTTGLLSIDVNSQQELLKLIELTQKKSDAENKTIDATLTFDNFGITVVSIKQNISKQTIIDRICLRHKYNLRVPIWFLIYFQNGKMDFEIFEGEWKPDKKQEENLEEYRRMMWLRLKKSGEKLGRNDPCFCNSGKKYKKCCYLEGFTF